MAKLNALPFAAVLVVSMAHNAEAGGDGQDKTQDAVQNVLKAFDHLGQTLVELATMLLQQVMSGMGSGSDSESTSQGKASSPRCKVPTDCCYANQAQCYPGVDGRKCCSYYSRGKKVANGICYEDNNLTGKIYYCVKDLSGSS
ncbi:hypothetical protein HDE_01235 [Halotydeus destructor]|nr:hypothetical protein HDE_01235 [Halotydeus destructor]